MSMALQRMSSTIRARERAPLCTETLPPLSSAIPRSANLHGRDLVVRFDCASSRVSMNLRWSFDGKAAMQVWTSAPGGEETSLGRAGISSTDLRMLLRKACGALASDPRFVLLGDEPGALATRAALTRAAWG